MGLSLGMGRGNERKMDTVTCHQFLSAIKALLVLNDYLGVKVRMAMKRYSNGRRAMFFFLVIVFVVVGSSFLGKLLSYSTLLVIFASMPHYGRRCIRLGVDLIVRDICR